jgi:hypothetical protein
MIASHFTRCLIVLGEFETVFSFHFSTMLMCLFKQRSHEKELGRSSGWMFLDAANELFLKARKRVYKDETKSLTKADLNNRYLYSKENKGYFNIINILL